MLSNYLSAFRTLSTCRFVDVSYLVNQLHLIKHAYFLSDNPINIAADRQDLLYKIYNRLYPTPDEQQGEQIVGFQQKVAMQLV